MSHGLTRAAIFAIALMMLGVSAVPGSAQTAKPQRVYMVTDMEGVDGIFDVALQCEPWKSPSTDFTPPALAAFTLPSRCSKT